MRWWPTRRSRRQRALDKLYYGDPGDLNNTLRILREELSETPQQPSWWQRRLKQITSKK